MRDSTTPAEAPAGTPASSRVRLRLRLFGAFRELSRSGELTLEVPAGTTVAGVRVHLKEALARAAPARRHEHLVELSAIATDSAILAEGHRLGDADASLSILPPVCGG